MNKDMAIALCFLGLVSCTAEGPAVSSLEESAGVDPVSNIEIGANELADVEAAGEKGDPGAINRLQLHYSMVQQDEEKAMYWQARGVEIGHFQSIVRRASALAATKTPDDCDAARDLLTRAERLVGNDAERKMLDVAEQMSAALCFTDASGRN